MTYHPKSYILIAGFGGGVLLGLVAMTSAIYVLTAGLFFTAQGPGPENVEESDFVILSIERCLILQYVLNIYMRKTLRIEDDLDHMIDVIRAKALLDQREKITYTSALNLVLLMGLDAFPSEKRWKEIYDEGSSSYDLEEFFVKLEEKIRGSDVPEEFLKFDHVLEVHRDRLEEELGGEDEEEFP